MQRRLAAILLIDMVGYSRLMGLDEEGTIARQQEHRDKIIDPTISTHGGRLVKTTGDGLLVEFPSVVDAVKCAIEVQKCVGDQDADVTAEKRIQYRVGINLGDIVAAGDDILGDGVNVAARLEALAQPGGICVSGTVYDQLAGKLDAVFESGGEQMIKNVQRPVQVWHWENGQVSRNPGDTGHQQPPVPDKPSIAVLPFQNMSGDSEQEFFADGIADDLITALSRFRSLFVIARNSSFTYKGGAINITQVGRELGVRYVVEGSVRKAGNRVRITAQLVDANSGGHLWADRFDGNLDDVFDLQDEITEQIVVAIEPEIQAREINRLRRKPPQSLSAWELLQQGLSHLQRINETDRMEAIVLLTEATRRDPGFAAAHAHLAYTLCASRSMRLTGNEDIRDALNSAQAAAEKAIFLDANEPIAHYALGRVHMFIGDADMAIAEMQTAASINPNFAQGHYGLGWAKYYSMGQVAEAIPHLSTALRLSPRDPRRWLPLMIKGSALSMLGRHADAVAHCRQACRFPDRGFMPYMHLAEVLAEAGQQSEAYAAVEKAIDRQPDFSIKFLRRHLINMHETTLNSLLASLRKAGAPE